jgi:hypothetical protein
MEQKKSQERIAPGFVTLTAIFIDNFVEKRFVAAAADELTAQFVVAAELNLFPLDIKFEIAVESSCLIELWFVLLFADLPEWCFVLAFAEAVEHFFVLAVEVGSQFVEFAEWLVELAELIAEYVVACLVPPDMRFLSKG